MHTSHPPIPPKQTRDSRFLGPLYRSSKSKSKGQGPGRLLLYGEEVGALCDQIPAGMHGGAKIPNGDFPKKNKGVYFKISKVFLYLIGDREDAGTHR